MRAPSLKSERIEGLDVVRGLAILGILPVNAAFFAYPVASALNPGLAPQPITADTAWTWAVMHVGFELKMVTLFSMLFGVSVFLVGGERMHRGGGPQKAAELRARLGWLTVFGLLHGLFVWYGDILFTYGLCGFAALMLRGLSARMLVIVGGALLLCGLMLQAGLALSMPMMDAQAQSDLAADIWDPGGEDIEAIIAAMQAGVGSALQENVAEWLAYAGYIVFYFPRTLGLMLLGLALFKTGFFSGRWPGWTYLAAMALAVLALALVGAHAAHILAAGPDMLDVLGPGGLWNALLSPVIALGYAAALVWLVHNKALAWLTNALAPVGRMAFTNYLTQSLIMTTLFWGGRGWGLFGEIDRVGLWLIVVAIWALQLIWSPLWLRFFAMGPFEWVWRSLSRGRWQSMRKPA